MKNSNRLSQGAKTAIIPDMVRGASVMGKVNKITFKGTRDQDTFLSLADITRKLDIIYKKKYIETLSGYQYAIKSFC